MLIKKLKIKKSNPTIVISTFKTGITIVGLFFIEQKSQGRNWSVEKTPTLD